MTIILPQTTPKSKRRRIMPRSPTSQDTELFVPPDMHIPSIPSLSKIDGNSLLLDLPLATRRPRQRTASFDAVFCFDPASVSPTVGPAHPQTNSSSDHYIDHNLFNKRRPPFTAKESDTFRAFTKPAEGSSFGASSSFIGLGGLLPEDVRCSQSSLAEAAALLRRNNSSIGLDMSKCEYVHSETKKEGEE